MTGSSSGIGEAIARRLRRRRQSRRRSCCRRCCLIGLPGKILAAWRHGSIEVVLSAHILDALRRVLPRLAHRHGLTAAEIDDLVDALSIHAEVIDPLPGNAPDLRDAKDQPQLATLLAAIKTFGGDYLVTGDKDLLALAERYPIVTAAKFWATHGGI